MPATDGTQFNKFVENFAWYYTTAEEEEYELFSDFILISSDEEEIKAHKFVLAAHSEYFRGLLRRKPSLDRASVPIKQITLKACIDGLYCNKFRDIKDETQLKEILVAANYLGIVQILDHYSQEIFMVKSNCFGWLQWAFDNCIEAVFIRAALLADYLDLFAPHTHRSNVDSLSQGCLIAALSSLDKTIHDSRSLFKLSLHEHTRVLYIINKFLKFYLQNSPFLEIPEKFNCLIRENINFSNSTLMKSLGKVLSILLEYDTFPRIKNERLVSIFQESFIFEEILSTAVETTTNNIFEPIFKDDNIASENINYFRSTIPSCLISERKSYINVVSGVSPEYGCDPDMVKRRYRDCDLYMGDIRKLSIITRHCRGRIVVKGMEFFFRTDTTGCEPYRIVQLGLTNTDEKYLFKKTFQLKDDEYISYVKGREEFMLDQITFVTNKNRKLGPVGGIGGVKFCTLKKEFKEYHRTKLMESVLRGFAGVESTYDGSKAVSKLRFITTVMSKDHRVKRLHPAFEVGYYSLPFLCP